MSGETNLAKLLATMSPVLLNAEYVFGCVEDTCLADVAKLKPIATFVEKEGLTVITAKDVADTHGLEYTGTFRCITLNVHSSLEAVGLTAAVSAKLTQYNISANVVAAYYHDHIFVPANEAKNAMNALEELIGGHS